MTDHFSGRGIGQALYQPPTRPPSGLTHPEPVCAAVAPAQAREITLVESRRMSLRRSLTSQASEAGGTRGRLRQVTTFHDRRHDRAA